MAHRDAANTALPRGIEAFFERYPAVAVALSGGVDSACVLACARRCVADARAYYVHTAFQSQSERDAACETAALLGVELRVIELDIMADEVIVANASDRCYRCKRALMQAVCQAAREDGCDVVVDGTNATDDAADRPGMRALAEAGVLSPLRLCGMGKDEVRALARQLGLSLWDKPSCACLATRFPTGTRITGERLAAIEEAEGALARMGFADFRVRLMGDAARLQVRSEQLGHAVARRHEIVEALAPRFASVLLDLEARE